MIFLNSQYLHLINTDIEIAIFSGLIVYNTQRIAWGRYAEITYDDYVIGALILSIDIIGLFLHIISVFDINN